MNKKLTKIDKLKTIADALTGFSPDNLETYLKWIDDFILDEVDRKKDKDKIIEKNKAE